MDLIKAGLTVGQPKALNYLGLHNGNVQKNIATGCQIDSATLTRILNRMEEKGLIKRYLFFLAGLFINALGISFDMYS